MAKCDVFQPSAYASVEGFVPTGLLTRQRAIAEAAHEAMSSLGIQGTFYMSRRDL